MITAQLRSPSSVGASVRFTDSFGQGSSYTLAVSLDVSLTSACGGARGSIEEAVGLEPERCAQLRVAGGGAGLSGGAVCDVGAAALKVAALRGHAAEHDARSPALDLAVAKQRNLPPRAESVRVRT